MSAALAALCSLCLLPQQPLSLVWAPASGPVAAYLVAAEARDGRALFLRTVTEPRFAQPVPRDTWMRVRVRAVDADGNQGPWSEYMAETVAVSPWLGRGADATGDGVVNWLDLPAFRTWLETSEVLWP